MNDGNDEAQIRQLVTTWLAANAAGDVDAVLNLMTEDVVFLTPGQPPMSKQKFAELSKAQSGAAGMSIKGNSKIQEVKVLGDWAFMWTQLSVIAKPKDGSDDVERAGHTLTILRKENGRWLLARDANMLVALPAGTP
jgi:uncharacterized protein (TIGR02246 family)